MLHYIDRQANGHADRLANAALDRRASKMECGVHPAGQGGSCTALKTSGSTAVPPPARPVTTPATVTPPTVVDVDEDDDMGDIDDGEVYAAMRVGPEEVPQRRPRLRLRKLDDDEREAVGALVGRLAATLAAKISDADDWETAEGYITALPHTLYDRLQPYTQPQHQQHQQHRQTPPSQAAHERHVPCAQEQHIPGHHDVNSDGPPQANSGYQQGGCRSRHRGRSGGLKRRRRRRPRVTRHHREHRLDEALDELHAVGRSDPSNRQAVAKARRRVGRINSSIVQQRLRHQFDTAEKACVDGILAAARAKRGSGEPTFMLQDALPTDGVDTGICPIPSATLHDYFTAVSTPERAFNAMAPVGAPFRSALARLPAATSNMELLTEAPSPDNIED